MILCWYFKNSDFNLVKRKAWQEEFGIYLQIYSGNRELFSGVFIVI